MSAFVEKLRENMADNEHQANMKAVLGIIRKAGKIRRMDLIKKLDGKLDSRSLDGIIKMIVEGGAVEELKGEAGPKGGRPPITYIYRERA